MEYKFYFIFIFGTGTGDIKLVPFIFGSIISQMIFILFVL
jgi:hypothetical protein